MKLLKRWVKKAAVTVDGATVWPDLSDRCAIILHKVQTFTYKIYIIIKYGIIAQKKAPRFLHEKISVQYGYGIVQCGIVVISPESERYTLRGGVQLDDCIPVYLNTILYVIAITYKYI